MFHNIPNNKLRIYGLQHVLPITRSYNDRYFLVIFRSIWKCLIFFKEKKFLVIIVVFCIKITTSDDEYFIRYVIIYMRLYKISLKYSVSAKDKNNPSIFKF